jgi:asparagine synthase (glutamine-hydrolysing)
MFKAMMPAEGLFQPEFVADVQRATKTYVDARAAHPITFGAFRQSSWYLRGVFALEGTQLTVRAPFLDNEFVRVVYRGGLASAGTDGHRTRLITEGSQRLASIPTDRGMGLSGQSALRRFLLEFTFKAEYAYDYGMPQWVARIDHAFSALQLDRLFLGRHKAVHFRVWYRDQLANYIRETLLDPRALSRPYFDRKRAEYIVTQHTAGRLNYTLEIHKLLTLELLHRLFVDTGWHN